ncbi:MAG TPA: helix-turn-helix transcriptional regulator, partial [Chloroflexota bacterium]
FWVPEWDLPPGQVSRQQVLTYPVVNLVVQPHAFEGDVTAHGPHTSISHRDLEGRGWAVGTLLEPAAVPAVLAAAGPHAVSARALVDNCLALHEPDLLNEVSAAMSTERAERYTWAIEVVAHWLRVRLAAAGAPDREGLLANALLEAVRGLPSADAPMDDSPPLRVAEVARELGTSARTLERVSLAHTGFTPAALIRRRRLQEAADRLQRDPTLDLTSLAHEVGYADHAHLTRDFRAVLGFTPSDYRLGALEPRPNF